MDKLTLVQAVNRALQLSMQEDPDVILLGQDIGKSGGVFRATEGLMEKFGVDRVMDTPLAESAIVGCAVGMALYGLKPVAEMQFSGFAYQAFHQIEQHVSRYRNRTRGEYPLPMVIRMPYGGGVRAFEHHSESREAYYVHTPGLKVVVPSTPSDALGLLRAAIRDPDPVIFMEPKKIYRSLKEEIPGDGPIHRLGEAKVVRPGEQLTLISYGAMMPVTLDAAAQMGADYSIEVIDLRTLKPLDEASLVASVQKTGRAVVVHEAPRTLGMGAEISALLMEKALLSLKAPVARVTGYDVQMPYYQLENHYLPSVARVVQALRDTLSY
ncbi:MAG: alpha-ketoacid dehydrogenase subunit beta [Deltaproteobacteria bacterium]|nr:alpha-ketoacid dehydrogenase subunit beta [Deltaproteobacteria bacterium]